MNEKVESTTFDEFEDLFFRNGRGVSRFVWCRRFRALFGVSSSVALKIWEKTFILAPKNARPQYLLWALFPLKVYAMEHINRILCGANEKTFRTWAWCFIGLISLQLKVRCSIHVQVRKRTDLH